MDPATLAAICLLHARDPKDYPAPVQPATCSQSEPTASTRSGPAPAARLDQLRAVVSTVEARDAMARTVLAEAGNQGDSGLAGVAYTILNRLADGRWGGTVDAVVDAPGQFEPVIRAGGSWRRLRPVTATQEARVSTIVNLALDGRLPDLTGGARYFQNPQIVAARARVGTVSESLVDFGGATPSAVIGAHSFYVERARRSPGSAPRVRVRAQSGASASIIFVGENRAAQVAQSRLTVVSSHPSTRPTDDGGAIFVQ